MFLVRGPWSYPGALRTRGQLQWSMIETTVQLYQNLPYPPNCGTQVLRPTFEGVLKKIFPNIKF